MSRIFKDKKLRRIIASFVGNNKRVVSLWLGSRRIWPDDSARSNALRFRVPEYGTLDWAYWMHAIDAVTKIGARSDCYMRFKINGKYYYLIKSLDKSKPLVLDGGTAYYENGQTFPADGLGTSVQVEVKVPRRCGSKLWTEWHLGHPKDYQYYQNTHTEQYDEYVTERYEMVPGVGISANHFVSRWKALLPIIPNTWFYLSISKGSREQNPRLMFDIKGLPSGADYYKLTAYKTGGRGEQFIEWKVPTSPTSGMSIEYVGNELNNQYKLGDYGYLLELRSHDTGWHTNGGACVVFPDFTKTFTLPIISVNTAG